MEWPILWAYLEHRDVIMRDFAQIGAALVSLCSIASAVMPPASQPGLYANVRKTVNLVAINVGHAKNKE